MGMFKKIKDNIIERMRQHTDSRQPTGDEVRIAWLVDEVERLRKSTDDNHPEYCADKCPFDGKYCWHWVQGHCIHINGVVPEGKPCNRHPDGKEVYNHD